MLGLVKTALLKPYTFIVLANFHLHHRAHGGLAYPH